MQNEYPPDFHEFVEEFQKETDRGMVIISASYIDNLLAELIAEYLKLTENQKKNLLNNRYSVINSFSGRIDLVNALGFLKSEDYSLINTIRKIRNGFAHKMSISLYDSPISDQVDSLHVEPEIIKYEQEQRREKFLAAAAFVIGFLSSTIKHLQEDEISGKYLDVLKLRG